MDHDQVASGPTKIENDASGGTFQNINQRAVRFGRWSVAVFLRCLFWYTIVTAVLRCPSDPAELDGLSPRVCQPYLTAQSHVVPFVRPYYEAYAGPYVEVVQPYAHNFNRNIYVPTKSFAVRTYRDYGAPCLDHGSQWLRERWETTVTPRLRSGRDAIIGAYGVAVRPYIRQAKATVTPGYRSAVSFMAHLRNAYISPYYARLEPAAGKVYYATRDVFVSYVSPWSLKLWSVLASVVNDTILPRVSGLYVENIEPQLVRIGQKLASYREEKDVQRVTEDADNSVKSTMVSTSSLPSDSIEVDSPTVESSASGPPAASTQTESPIDTARPKVASDLEKWQEKFALAADKGCEDLEEQVMSIVQGRIDDHSEKKGKELLGRLETVAQKELKELKDRIIDTVQSVPEDASSEAFDTAHEQLLRQLKSTGKAIREPAHDLRQWYNDYDSDLVRQVSVAVSSTLEILDGIRSLGLQEIGMRWAWMDGVTYKDWAKYHALKQQFSDWRGEVSDVGMQHPSLMEARATASDILSRGMEIAEATAKELARLKDVGKWKLEAGDTSDNFETPTTDPAEFRARKQVTPVQDAESLFTAPDETANHDEGPDGEAVVSNDGHSLTSASTEGITTARQSTFNGQTESIPSEDAYGSEEDADDSTQQHMPDGFENDFGGSTVESGSYHTSRTHQDDSLSFTEESTASSVPGPESETPAFGYWFEDSEPEEFPPKETPNESAEFNQREEPDLTEDYLEGSSARTEESTIHGPSGEEPGFAYPDERGTPMSENSLKWMPQNVRERVLSLADAAQTQLCTERSTTVLKLEDSSATSPTETI